MTIDKQKLQKLLWAEAASFRADCADWKRNTEALQEFLGEKTVEEVALDLLADTEAIRKDLESHKRMLLAAVCDLGAIGEALKSDMDADGDELLGMVIDLKAQNTRMLGWLEDISRTSGDKGAVMGARQLLKEFAE
ncbi:hypothetical protein [Pseudomonas sp. VE 196-7]|uniref:hypothetical protein n=1 Tax=Pseudomonas sp. VE 196-7 TaxID=2956726 RepID=UPI0021D4E0C5|nr:hypothetical protein [Pseudomonas sp. VE 196-7]MCU7216616.1 hypothetical protein [Pseudomonas sp. VE 196-7]